MRAELTVEEKGARRRFPLHGPVVVGRDRECEVQVPDPTVSRRHASLAPTDDAWVLQDLGSGNGTFLDGKRVDEATLHGGELLRFGTLNARFETAPEEPLSASQVIQLTLTQTLSIRPARRTRTKAAVVALVVTVTVLLLATLYHRSLDRPSPAPRTSSATSSGTAP